MEKFSKTFLEFKPKKNSSKEKYLFIIMNTLIIAPHPDDEILGAGGTLKKKIQIKRK